MSFTIVVLGGAGAMGRIAVKDLVETTAETTKIVIADYDEALAKKMAKEHRRPNVVAAKADATNIGATTKLLKGAFSVINCVRHEHNLKVMRAALDAGAHYTDLGGLFHVTREQLELDRRFKKVGLLALTGMGAAPGVTNVLAASAADTMEEVHEIHIYVGGVDRSTSGPGAPLATAYTIETILDEATLPAAVFTHGKFGFVDAMSGAEEIRFPDPVGVRRPSRTIHSEVATLPLTYKSKGIKEVSFRIAFPDELDRDLRFLSSIGMLSADPVSVEKAKVRPRDVLVGALRRRPRTVPLAVPDEFEVLRAVVRGRRAKKLVEETVDCEVPGIPSWGYGIDVDTGCPPSIAMQLLAKGEITARGVVPPEQAIPFPAFERELLKRGMIVRRKVRER